jgi:hypothetical protein
VPGDATEPCLAAGGVLFRCEPEPGRELAAVLELVCVRDAGNDGRRAGRADATQLLDSLRIVVATSVLFELALVLGDPFVENPQVLEQIPHGARCLGGQLFER